MRQSIRSLARAPGLSLFIVAILAVSIGANAAVYTLVDRVLLRPFSYPNLSRLAEVTGIAPAEFEVWRGRVAVFERAAIWRISRVLLTSVPDPDNLSAFEVGPDLFDTLGVHARLGRTFTVRDHRPDAKPTVVISDRLWRRQFASDPAIVGRQIVIDGQDHTVVGVMGPDFLFTSVKVELWLPLRIPVAPETGLKRHFSGVALLSQGVDLASARRQFGAVVSGTPKAPGAVSVWHGELRPFTEQFTKPYRAALLACQGAIALVLLIACANAGGLLLARNTGRRREFAVRASLGAGRARIAAQVITESLILSGCAALAGVPIAVAIVRLLLALWPADGTAIDPARVTVAAPALAWTLVVAVASALLCSLAPCVHLLRSDPFESLKSGPGSSPRGSRIRSLLVAAEVGMAIVLVTGAGLMLASLNHLLNVRLGFEPEYVLTARIGIPAQLSTVAERSAYYTRIVDAVRPIPGVRSAAVVTMLPFGGYIATMRISAEGASGTAIEQDPNAPVYQRSVSPDYFRTVGIRVRDGRTFDDRDTVSSPSVAVINRTLAGQFWNRTNVTGLRIALRPGEWSTIIGVVEDAKTGSLTAKPAGELYLPCTQNLFGAQVSSLVVRTSVPPLTAAPSIQRSIHGVNPDQPVSEVKAMTDLIRDASAQPRLQTSLLVAFAFFALLLALGGVFATAAYSVVQRRREIAVRAALGAEPAVLFRWSMASTLRPVAWGTGAGLVGAVWSSRLLEAELYSVRPHDPAVLAGSAVMLILVALAAAVVPAWRASRIYPAGVLRTE